MQSSCAKTRCVCMPCTHTHTHTHTHTPQNGRTTSIVPGPLKRPAVLMPLTVRNWGIPCVWAQSPRTPNPFSNCILGAFQALDKQKLSEGERKKQTSCKFWKPEVGQNMPSNSPALFLTDAVPAWLTKAAPYLGTQDTHCSPILPCAPLKKKSPNVFVQYIQHGGSTRDNLKTETKYKHHHSLRHGALYRAKGKQTLQGRMGMTQGERLDCLGRGSGLEPCFESGSRRFLLKAVRVFQSLAACVFKGLYT